MKTIADGEPQHAAALARPLALDRPVDDARPFDDAQPKKTGERQKKPANVQDVRR